MPTYQVQCEAYLCGEFESEEAARQAFIDFIREEEGDAFGRPWTDFVTVENLGESDDAE